MEGTYPLYHTLNQNIPKTKLTKAQETKLIDRLGSLEGDAKKAVIMLATEHAKVVDQYVYDPDSIVVPYRGVQDGDDVIFDLKDFPVELKWILWKFIHLGSGSK